MAQFLRQAAMFFRFAWAFSLFINLALLLSPLFMTQVYDRVLTSRSLPTLVVLTVGVCVALAFYIALEVFRSRVLVQAGLATDQLLNGLVLRESFERAAGLGGVRHAAHVRDVATLRQYLSGTGLHAFFDAPWGLAFLVIIYLCHWLLGAVALFGMFLMVGIAVWDHRRTQPLLLQAQEASRDSARKLDAALRNAESVQAMGMGAAFAEHWRPRHEDSLRALASAGNHGGTALALSKGLRQVLQALMLATGAYLVIVDNLSSGVMLAATILLGKATAPLELAIGGWRNFVEAKAAYLRLDALLKALQAKPEPMPLPAPSGALALEGVSFALRKGDPPLLRGVSFALQPGECLAVVGPSGAGKSTLLRLLLGVWKPQSGTVRLDGADLQQWQSERLGEHVGVDAREELTRAARLKLTHPVRLPEGARVCGYL
ncbi:MAG: ATP-binding cassette domain-containing protein [Burkholderiales bacterium]|nr:ATP-binding cassette domain-containing protein [Burkholderiales bacterium]